MKQEYLFHGQQHRNSVNDYHPEGVTIQFRELTDDSWIVTYSISGENEDSSKKLSAIDKKVKEEFKGITLENGSSEYFNKRLYPLVSSFERKLRKLLYLASAVHSDNAESKRIKDLEEQDFGQIFSMLFVDGEFAKKAKKEINQINNESFTKSSVIELLESYTENVLWDNLLGNDVSPSLRNNFNIVRKYRNDVMHSHNIDFDTYRNASKLFSKINQELDSSINRMLGTTISDETEKAVFNSTLDKAIQKTQESLISTINTSAIADQLRFASLISKNMIPTIDTSAITAQMIPTLDTSAFTKSVNLASSISEKMIPTIDTSAITAQMIPTIDTSAITAQMIPTIDTSTFTKSVNLASSISENMIPTIDTPVFAKINKELVSGINTSALGEQIKVASTIGKIALPAVSTPKMFSGEMQKMVEANKRALTGLNIPTVNWPDSAMKSIKQIANVADILKPSTQVSDTPDPQNLDPDLQE